MDFPAITPSFKSGLPESAQSIVRESKFSNGDVGGGATLLETCHV